MSIFNFLGMLSNSKTDDDGGQALFKQISEELLPSWNDLHNAVCRSLDDLMVAGRKEDYAREPGHAVI